MFHRIKSEPQPLATKEKKTDQDDLVKASKADAIQAESAESHDVVAEADDDLSPVQRYARQQQSDMAQDVDVEEEAEVEVATETETEYQEEEKESEIMNENEYEDNTEEQTQEVSSYAPASVAGGYPGSYAGAGYTAPSAPSARSSVQESARVKDYADEGGRLVIGRGITMSGEIEACPHLVVEGTVEASLRGAEVLEVSEGGVFFGTVEIEEATISGRFEGDITVRGRLSVTSTGLITGSITYGELEMEAGASIDGKLTPMAAAQARAQAPKKAAVKRGSQSASSSANSDAQLFDQAAA